jgi:DNA polymerase IIIc chi subunit
MWEKPQGRFLPHKLARQPGSAPVSIGMVNELEEGVADVIINLTREAVPSPKRFQRLLEVVPSNNAQREASRKKFRVYLNLGLKPQSHHINRN